MSQPTVEPIAVISPTDDSSLTPGPFAIYQVNVDSLAATQLNVGFTEVDTKANAFDLITSAAALAADLLGDIEPVVIGPGGALYLTDGQHTFLALEDSAWGAADPLVDVNVIANFSGDTEAQFITAMETENLLYPVNDGVLQTVNTATGSPLATTLTGLTSDPYRGLEYSILKNKLSKLFTTTTNIAGVAGPATPGLDKTAAFYSDFIWADAYRDARGGLGLPTLSPGDILLATEWNLNGANQSTLPNVGTVYVADLPGFILPANIVITGNLTNAMLAGGTLDGTNAVSGLAGGVLSGTGATLTYTYNETTNLASFNGLRALDLGLVTIGADAPGFVLQLGADSGYSVTLDGQNSFTGGVTIIAGTLIINGDAALGAASGTAAISLTSIAASIEADNGIIFDSLTEGNGTLEITASFSEGRAIGVDSEQANINLNGNTLTLTGEIYSMGAISEGLSNAAAECGITVEDLSAADNGVLVLAANASNPYFYGNWIIGGASGAGTLNASSDASLGNTTGSAETIGAIDLNGGIFQAGASFASVRDVFLSGSSTYDTNGYTTSWAGGLQDVQRVLTVLNSSTVAAGAVSFASEEISATATLNLSAPTSGKAVSVTLTNGFIRDPGATVIIEASSGTGSSTTANETVGSANYKVFNTGSTAAEGAVLTDGIAAPWIAIANPGTPTTFAFASYGTNGYVAATSSSSGNTATLSASTAGKTVDLTAGATASGAVAAYALSITSATLALGTNTLTLGDGTDPTGLILNTASITGTGTIATGASELVLWLGGAASSIADVIAGSGGLSVAGGGSVTISAATAETGAVTINSGTVTLSAANALVNDVAGVTLANTKSHPSAAVLKLTASNQFATLNSVGNNSTVSWSGAGVTMTIGDSNNLSSTISSALSQSTTGVIGALTKDGSGLLDLSGSAGVSLATGSTMLVNGGAVRIANGVFGASATTTVTLAAGTELQYAGNAGSRLGLSITGAGVFHLVSGTVQLYGTNSYTGGTVLELGSTLDTTTTSVSTGNANITDAGGLVVFDQNFAGTYAGVISDGWQAGGPNDLNDLAVTSGVAEQGSLLIDDSGSATGSSGCVVTLTSVQSYTGATSIEAGTLTLDAVNAIASSSGLTLGRIGYSTTASLALGANNSLAMLASDPGSASVTEATTVALGSYTLTLNTAAGAAGNFAGAITGGGALVKTGAGSQTLSGASSFTGGITLDGGTLELANANAAGAGPISFQAGTASTLAIAAGDAPANAITGFAAGDRIDLLGVGTATSLVDTSGTLTISGGSASVALDIAGPPTGENFALASDGAGGTLLELTAAPTAGNASVTIGAQQTANLTSLIAPLFSAGPLDTLHIAAVSGHAVLNAGTVTYANATPGADSFTYTVADQYGDTATGTINVTVDGGPTTANGSLTITPNTSANVTALVDSLITPGIAGDSETITGVTGNAVLSNGTITYTAPGTASDSFTYTVQDQYGDTSTGTITVDVNQNFVLTTGNDTVLGGVTNTTITAAANTLTSGDSITGGSATNTLVLTGGGSFNLAAPKKLTAIQYVAAQEGQGAAAQTITLRAGLNTTVNVASAATNPASATITITGAANSDVINLGAGNDAVTLGAGETVIGGGGNNLITVNAASETVNGGSGSNTIDITAAAIGATINGGTGNSTLVITGGGTAVMGSSITNISNVELLKPTNLTLNSLPDVRVFGTTAELTGSTIGQFLAGDAIDLTDMASGSALFTSINGGASSTVLSLTDGTNSARLTLGGSYAGGSFLLNAAAGGTAITWQNAGYDIALPAQSVTYTLGAAANTVTATAANLLRGDSIDGGSSGANTLALLGGGSFNLATPATLKDFATITVSEGSDTTLTLRSGLNATVDVASAPLLVSDVDTNSTGGPSSVSNGITILGAANSDVINLGNGNDTVTLGAGETVNGGNGEDAYNVNAASESVHGGTGSNTISITSGALAASIDGGSGGHNTLVITNGGNAVMGASITGISTIDLLKSTNLTLNSLSDLVVAGATTQLAGSSFTNFVAGDSVDLTDMNGAAAWFSAIAVTAGTAVLTVTDGTNTARLTFDGNFTANSFVLGQDLNGGTLLSLAPTPATYTLALPASAVTYTLGTLANTVSATAANLLHADAIDGGSSGANTLALTGAGSFNLATPTTLKDFATITVQEGAGTVLDLRAGLNAAVHVTGSAGITIVGAANTDAITLGNGNDTVTLAAGESVTGGTGNDSFIVTAASIADSIAGGTGDNTLEISGGGSAVMGAGITGISNVALLKATNLTLNSLSDLLVYGTTANLAGSTISNFAAGDTLDLTDMNGAAAYFSALSVGSNATVLTVTDGTNTAKLTLAGNFTASSFVLGTDATGGTAITLSSAAYSLALPAAAATYTLGALANVVTATAANLLHADAIDGGGSGANTLWLTGAGTFNLATPATLRDFSTIAVQEGAGTVLDLRAGLNAAVDVTGTAGITINGAANGDVINLGGGADTVTPASGETVNGGSGTDTYEVTAATIGAVTINGGSGSNTLMVNGGGSVTMGSKLTGINAVQLAATTNFNAGTAAGLQISGSTAGGDVITLGTATQSVVAGGANETIKVSAANSGALVDGLGASSTLEITSGGIIQLNAATDIGTVKLDASSLLLLNGMSFITANGGNGNDTIEAGATSQTLIGGSNDTLIGFASGQDSFAGTAAQLNGDTIQGFLASDKIDLTNLLPTGASLTTSYSGGNTKVTVTSGTAHSSFTIDGTWSNAGFAIGTDGGNGLFLTHS